MRSLELLVSTHAARETARTLMGPISSFARLATYKISRGRVFPKLKEYFGPITLESFTLDDLPSILTTIGGYIGRVGEQYKRFVQRTYRNWEELRNEAEHLTHHTISDYVLIGKNSHVLFLEDGLNLVPLIINTQNVRESLTEENQCIMRESIESPIDTHSRMPVKDAVSYEQAIIRLEEQMNLDRQEWSLVRLSSATNGFRCLRHKTMSQDQVFEGLERQGGLSTKELIELHVALVHGGLVFDPQEGRISVDQEMLKIWLQARELAECTDQSQTSIQKDFLRDEIVNFTQDSVYFDCVLQWLKENPKIVDLFVHSVTYQQFAELFRNTYFSAYGLTEHEVGMNMLANYYLSLFEKRDVSHSSPSQVFMDSHNNYYEQLRYFVDERLAIAPPMPNMQDRQLALKQISLGLKVVPHKAADVSEKQRETIIGNACVALQRVRNEIERHKLIGLPIVHWLEEKLGFVVDTDWPQRLNRVVIGNIALARVPNERRFTESSWFPHTHGYLNDGQKQLFFFEKDEAPVRSIEASLRYIFNGVMLEMDGGFSDSQYESQVGRIYEIGAAVLDFLQTDESVPLEVREFMSLLSSGELPIQLIEYFGYGSDPMLVNAFFLEGFEAFRIAALHRHVTEFVRGVETELINQSSVIEGLAHKTLADWKNHDFSSFSDAQLRHAIQKVLVNAQHRIRRLNHEPGEGLKTLKDWMELMEKVVGWNSLEMQFNRYEKWWKAESLLGVAWHCICFSRKTIFNPTIFKQY